MFHWLVARIRRLPWWGQMFVWPVYGLLWLVWQLLAVFGQFVGWIFQELFHSARRGAQRVIAPLLWPAVGLVVLVLLYGLMGPHDLGKLLGLIIGLGLTCYALYYLLISIFRR